MRARAAADPWPEPQASAALREDDPASGLHDGAVAATSDPLRAGAEKGVVRRFFDALESHDVRYCHWKSNIRLAETLAGEQDIDLLVDPRDRKLLHSILLEQGFKLARSRSGAGHPGVFHALALDDATAELVDLHAYHQLVSGDSFVKSYRFPVEEALLRQCPRLHGVKVPAPEAELVLFVLRIALKHLSPVELLKVSRGYCKIPPELAWLRERADAREAELLCARWFPEIEAEAFRRLMDAVSDEAAIMRRVALGVMTAWRLRKLRRLGLLAGAASRFWRALSFAIGHFSRRRDLIPETGGLVVALVGPKATGKSTIGRQLAKRLGRHLLVTRIHAGKPPATALSFLPRLAVPLARALLPRERLGEYEKPERRRAKTYSFIYVLRMALLAHDRRKLLFRALGQATGGAIVVSDRYPSDTVGAIDSSCFDDEALERSASVLKRRLMSLERRLYRALPKPQLVLRLTAPVEVAIQRDAGRDKPGGPNAEAVKRRWELETSAEFHGAPVVEIDAGAPLEETVRSATRAVWNAL